MAQQLPRQLQRWHGSSTNLGREDARPAAGGAARAMAAAAGAACAAAHAEPVPPPPREVSGACALPLLGQHATYADGLARPLMRGWLHLIVAVLAGPTLLLSYAIGGNGLHAAGLAVAAAPAAAASRDPIRLHCAMVLVGYGMSAHFHNAQHATLAAYNMALALDLAGVAVGLTAVPVLLAGPVSAVAAATTAAATVAILAVVVARSQPVIIASRPLLSIRCHLLLSTLLRNSTGVSMATSPGGGGLGRLTYTSPALARSSPRSARRGWRLISWRSGSACTPR